MYDKKEIIKFLNENKVNYNLVEHEAVYTMEDIQKINIQKYGTEVKNLFLRDEKGKNHYLIVAKNDTKIDLKSLKDKIHSTKLSFASEERLDKYLKLKKGAVSPFGILNDENSEVKVYFDENLKNENLIGVHPNDNTASIFISTKDMENIIKKHGNSFEYISF